MTARRFVLALDQGTTGSRAVVVDPDGAVRGSGYVELPQYYPTPGWVEHDPVEISVIPVSSTDKALRGARVTPTEPTHPRTTNQRETAMPGSGVGPPRSPRHRLAVPPNGALCDAWSDGHEAEFRRDR
jgi:glycerol kinase